MGKSWNAVITIHYSIHFIIYLKSVETNPLRAVEEVKVSPGPSSRKFTYRSKEFNLDFSFLRFFENKYFEFNFF